MRFLKIILVVLVALTTFASAWGFEKGDIYSWDKQLAIKITDVKQGGKIATSKFYVSEKEGWAVFIFEKIDIENIYLVTLIPMTPQPVMSPFYIKEVRDGQFIESEKLKNGEIIPRDRLVKQGRITFLRI